MAHEPVFENAAQVGMLYSVARKLDYSSLRCRTALRFERQANRCRYCE